MVSFFGLKFGSEKKKSTDTPPPARPQTAQQPRKKRIDQNELGEGQFFGKNIGNTTVINGSIRSFNMHSRPGTANSMRVSPYSHPTHMIAASSMYDLGNVSHTRLDSNRSLKPAYSEVNLRTNFANASTTSLSMSSTYGDRPTTPGGTPRTKPWVNPLDVHFNRPSPAPSRSPLVNVELGMVPTEEKAAEARSSLFGTNPDDVAQAIMASVEHQEQQERAKKELESTGKVEREREARQQRQKQQDEVEKFIKEQQEWARERRERQLEEEKERAAAAAAAIRAPAQSPSPGQPQPSPFRLGNGPIVEPMNRPDLRGQLEQRPGSRNRDENNNDDDNIGRTDRPLFREQADPRLASRNGYGRNHMDRSGGRRGPHDRSMFPGRPDRRGGGRIGQHGHNDRPLFQGQMGQRPGSRNDQNGHANGSMNHRPMNTPSLTRAGGPGPRTLPMNGLYDNRLQPAPLINANGRPKDAHYAQYGQNPYGPTSLPSPPVSLPPSSDDQYGQQDSTPMIRNVQARRDTLTMNPSRRTSLSMTIEAFERSMIEAQGDELAIGGSGSRHGSDASSHYSVDARPGPPTYPLPPAPQRRPSPPYTTRRSRSPTPRVPGRSVRRPRPDEYGAALVARTSPKRRPSSGETGTVTYDYLKRMTRPNPLDDFEDDFDSPPRPPSVHLDTSMEPAPLFRLTKLDKEPKEPNHDLFTGGDFSDPRPAPTPSPKPGLSLNFAGPPTPDSTHNWPFPAPTPTTAPQLKRTNLPPPLNFNFSSSGYSGYSRNGTEPYTPSVRMPRSPGFLEEPRPHTSAGLGIGVARGPSVREIRHAYGVDRRPDHGLMTPTGIADDFGTPLI